MATGLVAHARQKYLLTAEKMASSRQRTPGRYLPATVLGEDVELLIQEYELFLTKKQTCFYVNVLIETLNSKNIKFKIIC